MAKKLVISTCSGCMYYDNVYYSYSSECTLLKEVRAGREGYPRVVDPTEIPLDCPLEDTEEALTVETLGPP